MESQQEDYHKLNNRENKAIIIQLIEDCDDDEVSKIIGSYTIGASDKDIRNKLNSFNKPSLEKAAQFLKINTEGKKKQELQTNIIMKLESLLREACPVCGEYYNIQLEDTPFFECIKCNQGCHNPCFEEMYQIMNTMSDGLTNSFHYMCMSCSEYNKVHKPVVEAKKHPSVPETASGTQPNVHNISWEESQIPSGQPPPSQPKNDQDPGDERPQKSDQEPQVLVCPTYKWGRCPNYGNCEFRHPPRCWNWLKDGKCKFKKNCKYHHPPLCRNSLREHKCLNENCKFFHVSKTLRHNREEEQLRSSLHKKTYDAQPKEHKSAQHPNQRSSTHPEPPPHNPTEKRQDQVPVNPQNNETTLSVSNVPFLVKTIRDLLREDLQKELTDLKTQISYLHLVSNPVNHTIQVPVSLPQKTPAQSQVPQAQPQASSQIHPQLTQMFPASQAQPNFQIPSLLQ